jgi:hypothetical protein
LGYWLLGFSGSLAGIPFGLRGFPFKTEGIPFEARGISFEAEGIPFTGLLFTFEKNCLKKGEFRVLLSVMPQNKILPKGRMPHNKKSYPG